MTYGHVTSLQLYLGIRPAGDDFSSLNISVVLLQQQQLRPQLCATARYPIAIKKIHAVSLL